jgi:hypothetical protein
MMRIVRPTILNSLTPVGFVGAVWLALGIAVLASGIATMELVLCFLALLGFCILWCVQSYRRITVVSEDGVAVRDGFGRLRQLSWSDISHSRVLRCAGVGVARLMRGAPVRVEVFSASMQRPALVIPVVAYRAEDVQFLLHTPSFKYESHDVG